MIMLLEGNKNTGKISPQESIATVEKPERTVAW